MKNILLIIAVALVLLAGFLYYDGRMASNTVVTPPSQATSTPSQVPPTIIEGTPSAMYQDSNYGFSIAYPATASIKTPDTYSFGGYLPLTQTPIVGLSLPTDLFQGTNLGEAGVYIGATTTPSIVTACTQPDIQMDERVATSTTINGTPFSVFTSTGVGAGNIYDETAYRTVLGGNTCFEVVELMHSGNINNYPKGKVTQFNRDQFKGYLDAMVNSLSFGAVVSGQ